MLPQINTGNTGFMVLCASLVMLMTPGLAFFYGGLVHRQQRAGHHDPELRVHGLDHRVLVRLRLLHVLRPVPGRHHRRSLRPRLHARHRPAHLVPGGRGAGHPHLRARGLPDDVRHHHPGPDHRRLRQPGDLQGLHVVPHRLADLRLLPVLPHGLAPRRPAGPVGRARLRRRHRRPQHRRLWPPWPRCFTSASARHREPRRTASPWSPWAPACCGSAGTASTPAASSRSTR